jgi:hypothetical protein
MYRQIQDQDLVGKTIKSIENTSVNVLHLTFSDETTLEIWADVAVSTSFGDIPGIFVEEKPIPIEK